MNKKWTSKDDKYLKNNYAKSNKSTLIKELGRSWPAIQTRACRLEIKKDYLQKWNDNDLLFLSNNYPHLKKNDLLLKLNRSWSSIQNKAKCLKIKRHLANANIYNLTNETNEAYYWFGFLIADGHFNSNKQLQINLSIKDIEHLKKFASFIEYENIVSKPKLNVNYKAIEVWLDQFEITHNKTYNPCKFNHLLGDKLFSFIIGFIDGDGCIDKNGYLFIKCHNSWIENISIMVRFLSGDCNYNGRINSENLALATITNIETMKQIKRRIELLQLPVLDRKWSRIKFDKLSKIEKHNLLTNQCVDLFIQGFSPNLIIKKTGISRSFVYKTIKYLLERKS